MGLWDPGEPGPLREELAAIAMAPQLVDICLDPMIPAAPGPQYLMRYHKDASAPHRLIRSLSNSTEALAARRSWEIPTKCLTAFAPSFFNRNIARDRLIIYCAGGPDRSVLRSSALHCSSLVSGGGASGPSFKARTYPVGQPVLQLEPSTQLAQGWGTTNRDPFLAARGLHSLTMFRAEILHALGRLKRLGTYQPGKQVADVCWSRHFEGRAFALTADQAIAELAMENGSIADLGIGPPFQTELDTFPASQRATLACRPTSHPRTVLIAGGKRLRRADLRGGTQTVWESEQKDVFLTALAGPDIVNTWQGGRWGETSAAMLAVPPREHLAATATSDGLVLLLDLRRSAYPLARWEGLSRLETVTDLRFVEPHHADGPLCLVGSAPYVGSDIFFEAQYSSSGDENRGRLELSAGPSGRLKSRRVSTGEESMTATQVMGYPQPDMSNSSDDESSSDEESLPWMFWKPLDEERYIARRTSLRLYHGRGAELAKTARTAAGWDVYAPSPAQMTYMPLKTMTLSHPRIQPLILGSAYIQREWNGRPLDGCLGLSVHLLPSGDITVSCLAADNKSGNTRHPSVLWPEERLHLPDEGTAVDTEGDPDLAMPTRIMFKTMPEMRYGKLPIYLQILMAASVKGWSGQSVAAWPKELAAPPREKRKSVALSGLEIAQAAHPALQGLAALPSYNMLLSHKLHGSNLESEKTAEQRDATRLRVAVAASKALVVPCMEDFQRREREAANNSVAFMTPDNNGHAVRACCRMADSKKLRIQRHGLPRTMLMIPPVEQLRHIPFDRLPSEIQLSALTTLPSQAYALTQEQKEELEQNSNFLAFLEDWPEML